MTNTDDARQRLTDWYTEMGYVVHQLGEDAAHGTIEPHQLAALRDLLDRFERMAEELE